MHVFERLDHHELGTQQTDPVYVTCRDHLGPLPARQG